MNRMKPAIKRTLVYLICGFVMTWIVAWALAFMPHWIDPGWYRSGSYQTAAERSPSSEQYYIMDHRWIGAWERLYTNDKNHAMKFDMTYWNEAPGLAPFWWVWEVDPSSSNSSTTLDWHELKRTFEPQPNRLFDDPNDPQNMSIMYYSSTKYGWPILSHEAQGAYDLLNYTADGQMIREVRGAFSTVFYREPRNLADHFLFPYAPLWTGMVLNTIFYAIAIFILGSLKRTYRHARRLGKGRCPLCAYDLKFDNATGCSECGWRKETGAVV